MDLKFLHSWQMNLALMSTVRLFCKQEEFKMMLFFPSNCYSDSFQQQINSGMLLQKLVPALYYIMF